MDIHNLGRSYECQEGDTVCSLYPIKKKPEVQTKAMTNADRDNLPQLTQVTMVEAQGENHPPHKVHTIQEPDPGLQNKGRVEDGELTRTNGIIPKGSKVMSFSRGVQILYLYCQMISLRM